MRSVRQKACKFAGVSLGLMIGAAALIGASSAPSPDSDMGHAVKLAHWWAYYQNAMPTPAPKSPLDNVNAIPTVPLDGSDTGAPPLPTLRAKYDRTPIATGMDASVLTEFARLRAKLPATQAQQLAGWKIKVQRCTTNDPALLTVVNSAEKTICVAPILFTSLFLESVGTDMIRFTDFLKSKGIDPAQFDGSYDARINQLGVTSNDWASVLSGYAEPTWKTMRRSTDFVLARAILCGVLKTTDCKSDTVALVKIIDPGATPVSLVAALRDASTKYDRASWGYEAGGDSDAILTILQTLPAS